jgi:demethylmenaquinone methyltransferase/2-methoxy-6-polyprenyl-1,4-benzoquinol methylase
VSRDFTYKIDNENPSEKKFFIRKMFDSIAPTYDFLNRLLSFGIDRTWRNHVARLAGDFKNKILLDVCSGTGDLSKVFIKKEARVVSLDFSIEMLLIGRNKGWLKNELITGDASVLPFKKSAFDFLTIAFGIRNIPDIERFLSESARVLKKDGKLLILELTRPENKFYGFLYKFYLGMLLPFIGGIISRDRNAYKYLAKTIETFIDPDTLAQMIISKGFSEVKLIRKTFGTATIFYCVK